MPPILQDRLRDAPWEQPHLRRLPGVQPLAMDDWLCVDEAYAAQMEEKARLMRDRLADVHVLAEDARPAAVEALELVLSALATIDGFEGNSDIIRCPDGREVRINRNTPLLTLGQLVQEDICILQKAAQEHVLTAALLCFPAGWTLAEKIGRPLGAIHAPVADYDHQVARRVQRLMDGLRIGHPLQRANRLWYDNPALFQPRREAEPRGATDQRAQFFRSERQCLLRLPHSDAILFTIHTTVVERDALSPAQRLALQGSK